MLTSVFSANNAMSALVDITSYTLDDTATVKGISSPTNIWTSTGGADAITDVNLATYLYGAPSASGSVGLTFGTDIYNGAGSDLVFFFLGDPATFNLTVNGNNAGSLTSNVLTYTDPSDGLLKKYMQDVTINSTLYSFDISAAVFDVSVLGMNTNDVINSLTISGLDNNEYLALGAGFHTQLTPVPVPAAIWLFLSGFTALGLFARKRK